MLAPRHFDGFEWVGSPGYDFIDCGRSSSYAVKRATRHIIHPATDHSNTSVLLPPIQTETQSLHELDVVTQRLREEDRMDERLFNSYLQCMTSLSSACDALAISFSIYRPASI